jgi:hypothetical protein
VKGNMMNMKLFRNKKILFSFNTYHKFKSMIHVLLFVACHLYMLQNVFKKNREFIFGIHVMI